MAVQKYGRSDPQGAETLIYSLADTKDKKKRRRIFWASDIVGERMGQLA